MNRIILIISIILSFCIFSTHAQDKKKRVAILDPVTAVEDDGLKLIVREIVSGCFVNHGDNYAIVERSQLDKVMQEAKFSNTGAVDEAQATELGKLAGADKIVLTVISKTGNRCMLSVKMIDVETATVEKQHSKIVKYDSMLDVIEPLTLVLLGKGSDSSLPNDSEKTTSSATDSAESEKKGLKSIFSKKEPKNVIGDVNGCSWLNSSGFEPKVRYSEEFANKRELIELENEKEISVVFDFSRTYIDNMPLKEYLAFDINREGKKGLPFTEELNVYTPEIEGRFIDALNDKFKKIRFTLRSGNPYTLLVRFDEIDKPGRENRAEYIFLDTANGNPVGGVAFKSKGGRFGGFTNLLGDAMEEDAAVRLAKLLKKQFKNFRK